MRELTIGGTRIADDTEAWVIAELGHNHQGNLETCKAMIRAAAEAGADAVKLQKRDNAELYMADFYDQRYMSENAFGATYGEHREALEFWGEEYEEIWNEAHDRGVVPFATAFDRDSAMFLWHKTKVAAFKVASSDLLNTSLLRYVADYRAPMIISTGAASQQDVDRAVNTIWPVNQQLAILQCTAEYPVRVEHLNLNVITTYRERYPECVIGLSSHYSGISDVIAAYVLGARIFEKHFTLDRTMKGSDHAFSLEPEGFAKMVSYLRNTRAMLGSGEKTLLAEEQGMIDKMRKSTRWWNAIYGEGSSSAVH